MLRKEIFRFLATIFYLQNEYFDGCVCPISSFFKFANTILENAGMELIGHNSKNIYRLEKRWVFLVSGKVEYYRFVLKILQLYGIIFVY